MLRPWVHTGSAVLATVGVTVAAPSVAFADRAVYGTVVDDATGLPVIERDGLLLLSASGAEFAIFYDPSDHSTVTIPRTAAPSRFTAIVRDERGEYWGADRNRRFGPIDMRTQRLASQSPLQAWLPAVSRVGTEYFAINRSSLRFGKLDPVSGSFTVVGTVSILCCGSYGLAYDGSTLYYSARTTTGPAITPIDPATGIPGTPVPIVAPSGFHVEDMRFFHGTLYVASRDGTLVMLDPRTGVVTPLPVDLGRFHAIEVFE